MMDWAIPDRGTNESILAASYRNSLTFFLTAARSGEGSSA
jgi:hypothetical protein